MIAAVYARKSTEQNGVADEVRSVARQVQHGKDLAKRKGWLVPDDLIFVDAGVSGCEFGGQRPGLARLLAQFIPRPSFQAGPSFWTPSMGILPLRGNSCESW